MRLVKLTAALAMVGFGFLSFINETTEPAIGLKIGDLAPEVNSTLVSGVNYKSTDFKGEMVLIDFWASYDANSRIENHLKANLIEEYKEHSFLNGKGFSIVSVSLDRFKHPLVQAIESDGMNYPFHICDYQGRQSKLVNLFKANDLRKILIDGDGRIVAVTTSTEDISSTLQRLSVN